MTRTAAFPATVQHVRAIAAELGLDHRAELFERLAATIGIAPATGRRAVLAYLELLLPRAATLADAIRLAGLPPWVVYEAGGWDLETQAEKARGGRANIRRALADSGFATLEVA